MESRTSFYALGAGRWRPYVTLLHLPYTVWHLSNAVLGAAAAPELRLDRLGWVVLAFFLAVGIGAHALDELNGRPLKTNIPDTALRLLAASSIAGALGIGVWAMLSISLWAIPIVLFGGFIVVAYNLELAGGKFHTAFWLALAWGAFPAFAAYWASAETLRPEAFLVMAACFALTLVQRTLSTPARQLRRRVRAVSGEITYLDGRREPITIKGLLEPHERALRLLSLAVPLLALGWLVARL